MSLRRIRNIYNLLALPSRDRAFRAPRLWSNVELRKVAHLVEGDVVNVSAWKDDDKEGKTYRDYFVNASSYSVTNQPGTYKGFQNNPDEIALDLSKPLPAELVDRFHVVFNHTTLEHVFDFQTAFRNLCKITRRDLILVVPFLQELHGPVYGDFWRFSPLAVLELFHAERITPLYLSFGEELYSSVYVFALGSKEPEMRQDKRLPQSRHIEVLRSYDGEVPAVGNRAIPDF